MIWTKEQLASLKELMDKTIKRNKYMRPVIKLSVDKITIELDYDINDFNEYDFGTNWEWFIIFW